MLALALVIGLSSIGGMIFAWAGDAGSLDAVAVIQTTCFVGFMSACKLVISAGDSADQTATKTL